MKYLLLLCFPFSILAQDTKVIKEGTTSAIAFVKSLSEAQKVTALFPLTEMSRYDWHYLPATMYPRTGIAVKDLDADQKLLFYDLLRHFLSAGGYARAQDIMSFEYLLKELQPNSMNRIPENYFIAFYGLPASQGTWGWKFSGHHVALNFTVVDDTLAFAPFFFGVYPAEVKEGPKKGMRIIQEEEDFGFELINALSAEQKQKAIFEQYAFADIVTANSAEVGPLQPFGIQVNDFTNEQKVILNKLIVAHLSSMPDEIAKARMKNIVTEDINAIHFGWAGGLKPGEPHYYRIQGASFLIEYDNTQQNANHIHAVWRDFNGDFGRDLLKEHYRNGKHKH